LGQRRDILFIPQAWPPPFIVVAAAGGDKDAHLAKPNAVVAKPAILLAQNRVRLCVGGNRLWWF
jgi:hypothetical protein